MEKAEYKDVDCMICFFMEEMEREGGMDCRMAEVGKGISVSIPEGWIRLTGEEEVSGYLYNCHPQVIYRDARNRCDLLLENLGKQETALSEAIAIAQNAVRHNFWDAVFYESGESAPEGGQVMWFEYKDFAGSEAIYYLIFILDAEDERLFGAFHCPFEDYDRWKPILMDMLEHIRMERSDWNP